jgi:hypothetical protein
MAKKLSPMEQKASSKVLDALRKETQGMMKGKMDGLKKVTVASNSPEGLKKGLDIAEKIAGKAIDEKEVANDSDFLEEDSEENDESPKEEESEVESGSEGGDEDLSVEELDVKIKELLALKAKKQ